jgi:hypothetical protein
MDLFLELQPKRKHPVGFHQYRGVRASEVKFNQPHVDSRPAGALAHGQHDAQFAGFFHRVYELDHGTKA